MRDAQEDMGESQGLETGAKQGKGRDILTLEPFQRIPSFQWGVPVAVD